MLLSFIILGISVDCPNVINLAIGLHLDASQPAIYTQLQTDCCSGTSGTSPYVQCVSQRVTEIWWGSKGLTGTINGTALPSGLTILSFPSSSIIGPMPSTFPIGLTYMDLSQNSINGTMPKALPSGLQTLYLNSNQMGGDIPPLPSSIIYRIPWKSFHRPSGT